MVTLNRARSPILKARFWGQNRLVAAAVFTSSILFALQTTHALRAACKEANHRTFDAFTRF